MDKLDTLARLGRVFFGISLIAFGAQAFLWGDFVAGRAPAFPALWPSRVAFAAATGVVLILCGAAIVAGRKLRAAGLVVAAMIFAWAFLRNIPVALADRIYGGAWTALGKGLALTGGGLAVAGLPRRWTYVVRLCLGAFLISSGVQHFLFVPFVGDAGAGVDPRPALLDLFRGRRADHGRRRPHPAVDRAAGRLVVRAHDLPVVRDAAHSARAGCGGRREPPEQNGRRCSKRWP